MQGFIRSDGKVCVEVRELDRVAVSSAATQGSAHQFILAGAQGFAWRVRECCKKTVDASLDTWILLRDEPVLKLPGRDSNLRPIG